MSYGTIAKQLQEEREAKKAAAIAPPLCPSEAAVLLNQIAQSETDQRKVPGRTLPQGFTWAGHDIPGRGQAAARRLRQLQKMAERQGGRP